MLFLLAVVGFNTWSAERERAERPRTAFCVSTGLKQLSWPEEDEAVSSERGRAQAQRAEHVQKLRPPDAASGAGEN
jgi:hypothetical protein